MEIVVISSELNLKWRLKDHPEILISTDRKVYNSKTKRLIKETVNGGYSNGYWINRKFVPTNKMNDLVEYIPVDDTPF